MTCGTVPSVMETLSTAEAAEAVGVGVSKFHRLVAELNLVPVLQAPGPRGAMFWTPGQVEQIQAYVSAEASA